MATAAGKLPRMEQEANLIRSAQRGDEKAFEQLVQTYDAGVLRLAYNLLRSEEDARDVYQEAFLRVHRNLASFRYDCSFHTWLYRIVTNLCLDQLRRRQVRREESAVIQAGQETRDRAAEMAEDNPASDPERRLLSLELRNRVREILGSLTPRERMVFELRHYEGWRLRAIGEALGTTEEAAKNCLFRVTQKMRAALEDLA